MSEAVWELRSVSRSFAPRGIFGGPPHVALSGVDLKVHAAERVAIIGESGSGKTTLARVGLGLLPADEGSVFLLGQDMTRASKAAWRGVRSRAQLLFQDPRSMLNPAFPLGVLLRESARIHRPDEDATALVDELLEAVGLAGRRRARAHELSGGERRRAGLARVLLARPRLIVADEPTAGLDAALKADLLELLIHRAGPECAVVVISHDLPMVTWACHRVVVMERGRIVDALDSASLSSHDPHPATAALLRASGLRS
ncbi:MAG: ABC transporter ATP-binding protein [Deltaproteobacteria bacterium]|nr:MAG: ABC transporter ATP-binding protein [Deltaproteobacteria bacterium]